MQVSRLSILLPQSWLTFVEDYQHKHAVSSPSEVIEKALALLRDQELEDVTQAPNEPSPSKSAAIEQPQPTILQRMGGMPRHLLSVGGLSDRATRQAIITARLQARHLSTLA